MSATPPNTERVFVFDILGYIRIFVAFAIYCVAPAGIAIAKDVAPIITINYCSLKTTSMNPMIYGTAKNLEKFSIFIFPRSLPDDYGVYGPYPGVIYVHKGSWSYKMAVSDWSGATHLDPGIYDVELRKYREHKPGDGEGLASLYMGKLLAHGKLIIENVDQALRNKLEPRRCER